MNTRILLGLLLAALPACKRGQHAAPYPGVAGALSETPGSELELPQPPFSDGQFPCTDCHEADIPVNRTRRAMEMAHDEIVLHHGTDRLWCFDCHSPESRDKLHLASGELLDYADSHRLCGQCHGTKHREWRAGVHGRRSGQWDGPKTYLLCVHCHSAHAPQFGQLEPMPAPPRPQPRNARAKPVTPKPDGDHK